MYLLVAVVAVNREPNQAMRDCFQTIMLAGLDVWSAFTGKVSGPSCFKYMRQLLPKYDFEFGAQPIRTIAGSDNDSTCQMLMTSFRDPVTLKSEFLCAFPSIETHLTTAGYRMVSLYTPGPDQTDEEKAHSYEMMRKYLDESRDEAYNKGLITGPCLIHQGRQCPIYDVYEENDQSLAPTLEIANAIQTVESSQDDSSDIFGEGSDSVDRQGGERPGLGKESASRELWRQARWTHVEWGSQCIDFSSFGRGQRHCGPSTKPFLITVGELCIKRPLSWSHEITPQKTETLMTENKDLKEAGYRVITIVLCPTKNGRPYKRPRRHSFGWLEFCVEFLGSVEELELLFTRSVVLSGSIFSLWMAKGRRRICSEPDCMAATSLRTIIVPHYRWRKCSRLVPFAKCKSTMTSALPIWVWTAPSY